MEISEAENMNIMGRKKKVVLILSGIGVLLAILIFALLSYNSAKSVAKRFYKAYTQGNYKICDVLTAYNMKKYRVFICGAETDEEVFFWRMTDRYDSDIESWNDFYKATKEYQADLLEDQYGNYKIEIKVIKSKEISVKKLFSDNKAHVDVLEDKTGFDSDKVSAAKMVVLKVKITGDDSTEREQVQVQLVRIDGTWKVYSVD